MLKNGDTVTCIIKADSTSTCIVSSAYRSNSIIIGSKAVTTPTVSINASANNICLGLPVSFTAAVQHEGVAPLYQWNLNGQNVGASINVFSAAHLANGDHVYCQLTSSEDCQTIPTASNIISMKIIDSPVVSLTSSSLAVPSGAQVQLKATITGSINSYNLAPANALTSTQTLSPSTIYLTATTTFVFEVQNNEGCKTTKNITIKILNPFYMPNAFTPNGDGKNDVLGYRRV